MNFSKVDALMKFFVENTVPGCALTVMRGDEIIHESYAGVKDLRTKEAIDRNTMFRQASTTKLFTYAIMGMLYEEGKFLFIDPISEYLPEWKNTKKWVATEDGKIECVPISRPITIKDAVTMACGLPYCMAPMANPKNPTEASMSAVMAELLKNGQPTLREEVRGMASVPVMFDPGAHFLYGFGSEIAGAILEEITGKTVRENFTERIIEPLGLKKTDTYMNDGNAADFVRCYAKKEDGSFVDISDGMDVNIHPGTWPMGARANLNASAADFAVFMQMLANGGTYKGTRLLSPGTVRMLSTNVMNDAQLKDFTNDYLAGYGYGFGFRTLMDQGIGNHNGHLGAFGWTGGAGTWAEADPVTGTSIVYMHNMMPNEELYHHLRVRAAVYAALED